MFLISFQNAESMAFRVASLRCELFERCRGEVFPAVLLRCR